MCIRDSAMAEGASRLHDEKPGNVIAHSSFVVGEGTYGEAVKEEGLVLSLIHISEQGEILEKIGAQVVYPERDMAVRLARRLISKRIFNLFELDQNVDISEIKTTRKLTGQSVRDAQLRNRYGINIIAITRGGWLTTDVSPDYVFQDEDTVIVIGEREKIKRLADDLAR